MQVQWWMSFRISTSPDRPAKNEGPESNLYPCTSNECAAPPAW